VHSFQTVNGVAPYCASKGGITALTRNMAIDYGPAIRVNSIAPGWVLTPLIQSIFDSYDDPADQQRQVERRQVMKRIANRKISAMRRFSWQATRLHSSPVLVIRGWRTDGPARIMVKEGGRNE
jgi:NAD(P)-dependent dehydrogenase (short-subunit alcohol dehydrogenase family)